MIGCQLADLLRLTQSSRVFCNKRSTAIIDENYGFRVADFLDASAFSVVQVQPDCVVARVFYFFLMVLGIVEKSFTFRVLRYIARRIESVTDQPICRRTDVGVA